MAGIYQHALMNNVSGTDGYAEVAARFIEFCESVPFDELHQCILHLIPTIASQILDVGAGTGRDAAAFADMGHSVVAVEPMSEFLDAGAVLHATPNIAWITDSFPHLQQLGENACQFDFILTHAVWHHLDKHQRQQAMARVAALLKPCGVFALSLRHGPAGAGKRVFSVSAQETIDLAANAGFRMVLHKPDQPSWLKNKTDVTWTRLAFKKENKRNA